MRVLRQMFCRHNLVASMSRIEKSAVKLVEMWSEDSTQTSPRVIDLNTTSPFQHCTTKRIFCFCSASACAGWACWAAPLCPTAGCCPKSVLPGLRTLPILPVTCNQRCWFFHEMFSERRQNINDNDQQRWQSDECKIARLFPRMI